MPDAGGHATTTDVDEQDGERLEELASSSGLAPQLLSRIAHDIRSPLGLLSGALEEIREDLREQLDEGHVRMLSLAERGLARLDRMARMLSTMAQIESGGVRLQRETYDLSRLVREVVEAVEREDPRRGLTLELEVPEGTLLSLDLERMRESLWELVAQSRRQAASVFRIASTEEDGVIELRIEDDGRGLDSGRRARAFDRNHEPSDRRGTGFGLSVARDLVRAHGGDVTLGDSSLAPSRPGSMGMAFVVTLAR
jgi:signal transduction histidine kinase